jgi:hypothetical protein
MDCFVHGGRPAVGLCTTCQKAVCHDCIARDTPRIVCRTCASSLPAPFIPRFNYAYRYRIGFDYKSSTTIGGWPLVHICSGVDPATMRPRIAKGVIAIGSVALGGIAIGGAALGLVTVGGVSLGLLFALGGAALGFGLSMGGLAVGSFAVGGAALGFFYAIGGGAFAPAAIDGRHCDQAVADFVRQWLVRPFPNCR